MSGDGGAGELGHLGTRVVHVIPSLIFTNQCLLIELTVE